MIYCYGAVVDGDGTAAGGRKDDRNMQSRLLIVDDEAGIVNLLKDYFELNGYAVVTAASGAPVSYTHLDVYKRQISRWWAPRMTARQPAISSGRSSRMWCFWTL